MPQTAGNRQSDGDEPLSPRQRRVLEVLERCFAGSQSEMARQLSCTQAAISLIVRGKREPGSRFLAKICSLPGVPTDWMMHGKGSLPEGLLCRNHDDCSLPWYRSLDEAFGPESERKRPGLRINVAANDYSRSRLIFRVPDDRQWTDVRSRGLAPGDFLVFETDQRLWARSALILEKKICVITRNRDQASPGCDLGYVHRVEKSLDGLVESAHMKRLGLRRDQEAESVPSKDADRFFDEFRELHGRNLRSISLDFSSVTAGLSESAQIQRQLRPPLRKRELEVVTVDDVRAFLVLVIRRP